MNNFSDILNIDGSHEEATAVNQQEELETEEKAAGCTHIKEYGPREKKTNTISLKAISSPPSDTNEVKAAQPRVYARARVTEKRAFLPRALRPRHIAHPHPTDPLSNEAQYLAECAEFPGWIKVWQKLLELGKELKDDHTAKTFLGQFHIILKKDLAAGKVVLKQASLLSNYNAFFALLENVAPHLGTKEKQHLSRHVRKMLNTSWLDHEMEKIAKAPYQATSSFESFLEQLLLQSLFHGRLTEEEQRANCMRGQTAALHSISHSKEVMLMPINEFVDFAQGASAQARMEAVGVTRAQAKALVAMRDTLARIGKEIDAIGAAQKTHIGSMKIELKGLTVASQKLLDIRQALVDNTHQKLLAHFVCNKKAFLLELLNRSPKTVARELEKKLQPLIESVRGRTIYEKIDETILEQLEVYERLAPDISHEMAQGAKDPQEVFLGGVCTALTLRWASFEQFHPKNAPDHSPEVEFGTVLPQDRFNQAFYQIHKRLGGPIIPQDGTPFERAYTNAQYPGTLLKRLDMKEGIFRAHIPLQGLQRKEVQKQLIEELEKPHYQQEATSGVICMSLTFDQGAHRLYLHYAPKEAQVEQSIFRIVDSNIGIIDIKVTTGETLDHAKTRFYDRLFTILLEFYHTPNDVILVQMVPEAPAPVHA